MYRVKKEQKTKKTKTKTHFLQRFQALAALLRSQTSPLLSVNAVQCFCATGLAKRFEASCTKNCAVRQRLELLSVAFTFILRPLLPHPHKESTSNWLTCEAFSVVSNNSCSSFTRLNDDTSYNDEKLSRAVTIHLAATLVRVARKAIRFSFIQRHRK